MSATLLLNFHLAQLDHNGHALRLSQANCVVLNFSVIDSGRVVGRDLIQELYGDVNSIQVVPWLFRSFGQVSMLWVAVLKASIP